MRDYHFKPKKDGEAILCPTQACADELRTVANLLAIGQKTKINECHASTGRGQILPRGIFYARCRVKIFQFLFLFVLVSKLKIMRGACAICPSKGSTRFYNATTVKSLAERYDFKILGDKVCHLCYSNLRSGIEESIYHIHEVCINLVF